MTTDKIGVKRYESGEAIVRDRWERVGMEEVEDGEYVLWDDYEELLRRYEALQNDRDQQYRMKIIARRQRDAVAEKLASSQVQVDRLVSIIDLHMAHEQNMNSAQAPWHYMKR